MHLVALCREVCSQGVPSGLLCASSGHCLRTVLCAFFPGVALMPSSLKEPLTSASRVDRLGVGLSSYTLMQTRVTLTCTQTTDKSTSC